MGPVAAVGHRIVHGGRDFASSVILDQPVVERLRELIPLAPLHQPLNLEIVSIGERLFPEAVQIGCFDTAFHGTRPTIAKSYGLPRELRDSGVQSYGFHGLSYAYISTVLAERYGRAAGGRVIVAPPRQWRQPLRDARWQERRHDDGLLPSRRAGDEHAVRRARSRRHSISLAGTRHAP